MSCLPSDTPYVPYSCVLNKTIQKQIARLARHWGLGFLSVFLAAAGAFAVPVASPTFPSTPVGTASSAATVTVTANATGTVANVQILTLGGAGLDFAAGTGPSCQGSDLSAPNQTCQQSVVFTPAYPGIRLGAIVLLDSGNHVLGKAYISGTGTGGLGVFIPGNVITVAGTYRVWQSTQDGIPATTADLWQPASIAFDGAGNMYIADSEHNRIRKVAPAVSPATVGIISTFAGTGNNDSSGDGGPAIDADLNSPSGVTVDGAGNVYVADSGNNRIRKITPDGIITTLAGNGAPGYAGDTQKADDTTTELSQPLGVTVDFAGNLYIADTGNQRIRKVDAVTGFITTVAGNGNVSGFGDGKGTFSGDTGLAAAAGLSIPYAVSFDASGNMYIPDSANHCIRKVDAVTRIITTVAGTGTKSGYKGDGAAATSALLDQPSGAVVDPAGNLYIADTQNSAIRKVSSATGKISTLVINGQGNSLASNGSLGAVSIYAPIGLSLDGKGNLYFTDYYYMLVREVQSNAAVLNFTASTVFLGQQSTTPLTQTVENDGNGPLTLTSITPDANAVIDPVTTTCNLTDPLVQNSTCNIGAFFAPSLSVVIPSGQSKLQMSGNVDAEGATPNSPLDVILVGNAAPTNSSTLALSATPVSPSAYGQNVTFTATVTSGATPTGTVAFTIDGAPTVPASINLSSAGNNSAVATYTTATPLSVGKHTIAAAFTAAKGTNFLPDDSSLVQEIDAATATTLTSSPNGTAVSLGSSVTFTAKVAVLSAAGVTPDGTVTFYDGAAVIGSPVSIDAGGTATLATSQLGVGMHVITAKYSGDPNTYILASASSALNLDVQAGSATSLGSSPNPSIYGNSVTFVVTVTSNSGTPATGTVNFLDGANNIATAVLSGDSATATFTTSALTAGSHAITASYLGDANNASSSASIAQTVSLTPTVTTLAATPMPGIAGKAVTLLAAVKVASGSGTSTGSVIFTDGSTTLGRATLGAGGTASITATLAPGAHALVATYGGDANDSGSTSTALSLAVNLATTSVTVASSGSPATVLAPVTFTATVTGNGAIPTGSVVFSVDGASMQTVALDGTGKASFTDSALAVGSHAITAAYAGDTNDSASISTAFTQTVQAIPTTTSLGTGSTPGANPQTVLIATVISAAGPVPTGYVTFMDGSTTVGAAALDANGVATLVPDLQETNYNIVADYVGDVIHNPSSSPAVKVSGTPTGFAISVNPSTLTLTTSQNSTLSIKISSNNGYADTIGFGCGTLPAGVNCHFDNNTLALKAGDTSTVQLTIDTNSPLGGGATAMNSRSDKGGFSLAGLFLPAGLIFGLIGWRFRKRNAAVFAALMALFLSGAVLVTGCGGFSQQSAKPGTYTIQVTGVGSNSNISHYQNITLTITK